LCHANEQLGSIPSLPAHQSAATAGKAGSNFDPQVIAVAKEMFLHRLDCLD
jgi:hypothetical protein